MFVRIALDTSEYDSGVKDVTKSGSSLASKLKSGLASAGKAAAVGIGAITTAAGAAVGGLMALEQSTEEYRIAQGKLKTAFDAAGMSADAAQKAYNGFYEILGDTDTATEASQLLAKLAENEEDVSKWTKIAAGVNGTFGDSLPIEGLIEASNETAKVGQVTGVLADALNWAGISEDTFNEKLAACTSESERNQLIMETLSGTYDEASEAFYKNNKQLIESRKNQALMDATLAKLGKTVGDIKNKLTAQFMPALSKVATSFSDMISGVKGADKEFAEAIGELVDAAVDKLPEFLSFGANIITSILSGIIQSIPALVAQIPTVVMSIIDALSQMLPKLAESGKEMLSMLADGLKNGIPRVLEALPDVIMSILDYITENLPAILEMGVELIVSLAQGILDGIPKFLEKLPELIESFVGFIVENFPKILAAGADILINLAQGIIDAIPKLVERLPEILSAIGQGIVDLAWMLLDTGGKIVGYIIDGIENLFQKFVDIAGSIIGWIRDGFLDIVANINKIGENINEWIIDGINKTIGDFFGIGEDMVRNIWNGFTSAAQTLLIPGASSTAGSVANAVKNKLDINSPSRVFAEIGEYMAEGLGAGWDETFPSIKKSITNGMDFGTASVDFASSGLGTSSAGIINSMVSGAKQGNSQYTFNLVLPDGTALASYVFNPLVDYSKANGTPILNPT